MIEYRDDGATGPLVGIMCWPVSNAGERLQDSLLIATNYGTKVSGLVGLPPAWVPPFVALPAWLYSHWREHKGSWVERVAEEGLSLDRVFDFLSLESSIIVRSSAVGESMDDRGKYQSIELPAPVDLQQLIGAIEAIYSDFGNHPMPLGIGICIQQFRAPQLAGHVSNEVRLSATRNQWKYSVTTPVFAPPKGLNSKFAEPPADDRTLQLTRLADLSAILRKMCHWINKRIAKRAHLEWCVSGGELFILQLDEEEPTSIGEDPHLMPTIWFEPSAQIENSTRVFQAYKVQDDPQWRKLQNIRDFWTGNEPPKHVLHYATGDQLLPYLNDEAGCRHLAKEIDDLTGGRAVLRTDCVDARIPRYNLPRTNTVDGEQAVAWMISVIRTMSAKSVFSSDVAFILHRYIPARAAAWSYYSVGNDLVIIDCLWGLPDGLQFLEHDSYQMDARTGEILAADVPYKRHFLQEQSDGAWSYVKVARQFGRDRVLSGESLRHIAFETIAIANRVKEQAQVMWFCDIPQELGLGSHLPWFRSKDFSQHIAVKRPALQEWRIENLEDLKAFDAQASVRILRVDPEVDLVRNDEEFLDKVIEVALRRAVPVELMGSTLGHAYYKLRSAGVMVVSGAPTRRRVRKKQVFRKLVRDSMPQNIAAKGEQVSFGRLGKNEAVTALIGKLFEEAMELQSAATAETRVEELADVLEVIRGLTSMMGVSWDDLEAVAAAKREKRGGFENQTILMETARRSTTAGAEFQLQPDLEGQVTLRDVGVVRSAEGRAAIPFTRLITSQKITFQIPWGESLADVTIGITAAGLDVQLRERLYGADDVDGQADFFEGGDEKKMPG